MELFGNVYLPMPFWGWDVLGILLSVVFAIVIARIVLRVLHGDFRSRREREMDWCAQGAANAEARRILDERYAKGQINEEEYKRMKENLK